MPAHQGPANPPAAAVGTGATLPTPQTIAQVVEGIFTRFDANSNSSITVAEILSVLDPAGTHAAAATRAAAVVAAIDGNSDSALSKAEVTAAVTKLDTNGDGSLDRNDRSATATHDASTDAVRVLMNDHGPGDGRGDRTAPAPTTISELVDSLFTRFDANADKTITLTELLSGVDADGKHATDLTSQLTTLVKQLDSNADGGLTAPELSAALTQLDANANGTIDTAEYGPQPAGGATASVELLGLLVHCLDGGVAPHTA